MLAIDHPSAPGFRDTNLSQLTDPDLALVTNPPSPSMLRPADASRLGRLPFRLEDSDRPRAASEKPRQNGERGGPARILDDSPPPSEENLAAQNIPTREPALLSLDDTTELFRRKVADARQDTEHALAGSEAVSDAVKPKLTLDLGHSSIARLPESVVDLIKAEVERLSLSHNQIWHIPLRFAECPHLRYLNIRSNVFREIPRGVYKLHQLEILDVSRNKVRRITGDIKNLKALRVFSVVHNRVEDLPTELCEMTKLQILKIAENPLRLKLKKIVETKESEVSFSEMTDHERETAITLEIKRYLRQVHPVMTPVDVEASLQSDDNPTETTPKPLKRSLSVRFPVIPSSNSQEPATGGNRSSPIQSTNPPPVPTRSHYRMTSGTQPNAFRRPGIAPLIAQNNERNRSNSESVLQASNAARHKRMGMLRKEKPELDSIDELKVNRNSHLRGFSHGSVLKRNGALSSPGGNSSSSPSSPRDPRRQRLAFVKRLSSLPEHKVEAEWRSPVIEGAKGILYALYQIHPQISGLIAAIRGKDVRRSTLEFTFFNASTHVDRLNEALEQAEIADAADRDAVEDTVRRDCATCIMAYTHVAAQLQDKVKKIVAGTDARYVRTLMLLLYGSTVEVRNAIQSFGADVRVTQGFAHGRQTSSGNTHPIQTIPEERTTPSQPVRTITPTRDRTLPSRQAGRLRRDTAFQHPVAESDSAYPPNPVPPSNSGAHPTPIHLTGTTLTGGTLTSTSSTFSNSGTFNSTSSAGLRSRSNSRTAGMINGFTPSSVASTPRSAEGFSLLPTSSSAVRVNPSTGLTDAQEEAVFEQIFLALTRAYDAALHTIPIAKAQFLRCLEAAEENRQPKAVHDLWSTLVYRCKLCIDVSEALQIRLVNMRLKDPSAHAIATGSGRNDPSLWLLCKNFLMSFIELLTEMRIAKSLRLLSQELITMLRPVQKASREAGRLIETSPWRYLTDSAAAAMPLPSAFSAPNSSQPSNGIMNGNGYVNTVNGTTISNGSNASPFLPSSAASTNPNCPLQNPFPPPIVPVPPVPGPGSASTPSTATKKMLNGSIVPSMTPAPAAVNGISPVSVPLAATPLSAALGPAAQATLPTHVNGASSSTLPTPTNASSFGSALPTPTTSNLSMSMSMTSAVPSTPASAYGDSFFKGDVFQRADSLLSMQGQSGYGGFLRRG